MLRKIIHNSDEDLTEENMPPVSHSSTKGHLETDVELGKCAALVNKSNTIPFRMWIYVRFVTF